MNEFLVDLIIVGTIGVDLECSAEYADTKVFTFALGEEINADGIGFDSSAVRTGFILVSSTTNAAVSSLPSVNSSDIATMLKFGMAVGAYEQ